MNKIILHLEGFFILVLSLYFYWTLDFSWLLFILLLFTPDIAMLGYMAGNRTGAWIYNLFHTYSLPLVLILFSFILSQSLLLAIGLIWLAHIGMDRMVGYGLKYPTGFKETHLNRV